MGRSVALGSTWWICVAACALDATGPGGAAGSGVAGGGSTGVVETTDTSDDGGGVTVPGDTTSPTSDGDTTTTTPAGGASLVIVDGPLVDFADVAFGSSAVRQVEVHNQGHADATGLIAAIDGEWFGFAGGTYPGEGGTCGEALAPAESCVLVITCAAKSWGNSDGVLRVDYLDPESGEARATAELAARGSGDSENRVVNGGGERQGAPPPGWMPLGDSDWYTSSDVALSGTRSIAAGFGPSVPMFEAAQRIDVADWAPFIDRGGVTLRLSASARTLYDEDDPAGLRLRMLDGDGESIGQLDSSWATSTQWAELVVELPAPPGTRGVEIVLRCDHAYGMNCNAHFDDVTFVGRY